MTVDTEQEIIGSDEMTTLAEIATVSMVHGSHYRLVRGFFPTQTII